MTDHDLPPLTDPLLLDALDAARTERPSPARLARISAAILEGGPPPPPSVPRPSDPRPPSSPKPSPSRGPGTGALPPAAAPPSVLSGALIGAGLGALVSGVTLLWPDRAPESPRPAAIEMPVTMGGDPPYPPAQPAAAPRRAGPAAEPPRGPVPATSAEAPPARPPASASAAPVTAGGAAGAPDPSTAASAAVDPGGETEAHLLLRARDALAASPAQALALTQEHATRFPGGVLAQEREVVAIQALLQLGRAGEARARGARFLEAYPGTAHRRRVEALLGP